MYHTTPSFTSRCSRLLFGLLLAVAGFAVTSQTAEAQRVDCSKFGVTVESTETDAQGNCCASLTLENTYGSSVTGIRIDPVDQSRWAFVRSVPEGLRSLENGDYAAVYNYEKGMPEIAEDVIVCLKPGRNGTTANGLAVVTWYADTTVLCSDTIDFDCETAVDDCATILNQEIVCERTPTGAPAFKWFFTMKNSSDFFARNYTITSATQGVSISPGTVQSNGVASGSTFPRSNHVITGAQPGQTVTFLVEMCGSSSENTRDVRCCTTRVVVKMPECEREDACIDILDQVITCDGEGNPGAGNAYSWCFTFKNTGDFPIDQVAVGNSVVNVGPVAPGSTGRVCIRLYGQPGPTSVTLLTFGTKTVIDTVRNEIIRREVRTECEEVVRLELPKCEEGCFELVEQKITCDTGGVYFWCFNVRNKANWNMESLLLVDGPNFGIWPNPMTFNRPVPPGGLSERVCVRISGARPGPFHVRAYNNASTLNVLCGDSLTIELPECEPREKDCCENFVINAQGAQPVAGSNGFTGVLGMVQAGPLPITKASATIVSASVNGQPAFGYALNGVFLNPLGNGTVMPGQFGQEIRWSNPNGVPMMNTPNFNLNWFRFPPMAPNARVDTLRFCIRWQFTDTECRTCEKLVCYEVVRRRFVFSGRGVTGIESKGATAASTGEDFVGGTLTGDNSGKLQIYLPNPPAELGTVKYTGLTVQATAGAMITDARDADGSLGFTVQNGLAQSSFDLEAGKELTLDLDYRGLDGGASLGHLVLISYESSEQQGTMQLPVTVTLRRDGAGGGDKVDAVSAEVPGSTVQTFAIHVRNSNGSQEALSGIRLKALSEMEFLAVGPTSSKTEATLRFGYSSAEGHSYMSEAAEGTVTLPPGAERKPIYVTLAVGPESAPIIGYETLNEFGEAVSEGEIDLRQITSVRDAGDLTGSGLSQLGAVMPNPASGSASVTFTLASAADVNLMLRDARGVEVARMITAERFDEGNHVVTFDVAELPSGTYFATLETENGTETVKVVVRR